jgi:glycine dehydrogenase
MRPCLPRSDSRAPLSLPPALGESAALAELKSIASLNQMFRSYLGQGYYDTFTPPVIQRTILENPGWYTAYTPYQAEISQGRMEALLNFQTLVVELTGLEIANASMLDEATAAAEAMTLAFRSVADARRKRFFVSRLCHPQTLSVVVTRARPLGIEVLVGDHASAVFDASYFGALIQYPDTFGLVHPYDDVVARMHAAGGLVVVATDLLALTLLRPPGEFGADVAVGSAQRLGVPMGYGGPHAGFMATRDALKRQMPGRLIGVSKDAQGNPALRMALGTREQHIRRDKATSNICTAQVLLAVMASMYAVYHGPDGLRRIARRVKFLTEWLAAGLRGLGAVVSEGPFFDTLVVQNVSASRVHAAAHAKRLNLRPVDETSVALSLDETTTGEDLQVLLGLFRESATLPDPGSLNAEFPAPHARRSDFPAARGVPPPPYRARDAALHQATRGQGPVPLPLDDFAWIMHDEVERGERDAPGHLAGVRPPAPLRARGTGARLHPALPRPQDLAGRNHGVLRCFAPAERRFAR